MTVLAKLVDCAVHAPSGHNTQPWRFHVSGDEIRIFADTGRRLPIVDPDDHALFISLGCALENLLVAARHFGFAARRNDRMGWVELGRSFERVALTATARGIAHAHVNMPCEVVDVRMKLARHLGMADGEQPLLLIRLGYAKPMPRAPRRPLEAVMECA